MNKNVSPLINAIIVLHSITEKEYEVISLNLIDPYYDELSSKYGFADGEDKKKIAGELCRIEGIRELAYDELYEYGETSKNIHSDLWENNHEERFYCIKVALWAEDHRNFFGEVDTEIDFEYTISDFEKEWNNLVDLLQKESKIYFLDYEVSGRSYTITGIYEVHGNDFQKTGIWYSIHSDKLSDATGYYSILDDSVDKDRFFSTPELAHEAYLKFHKN